MRVPLCLYRTLTKKKGEWNEKGGFANRHDLIGSMRSCTKYLCGTN
jgi:hypothetical protein